MLSDGGLFGDRYASHGRCSRPPLQALSLNGELDGVKFLDDISWVEFSASDKNEIACRYFDAVEMVIARRR